MSRSNHFSKNYSILSFISSRVTELIHTAQNGIGKGCIFFPYFSFYFLNSFLNLQNVFTVTVNQKRISPHSSRVYFKIPKFFAFKNMKNFPANTKQELHRIL